MSVSSLNNKISYTANGVLTSFVFPYYFLQAADLAVYVTDPVTGIQTLKVLGTDYTVTGFQDPSGRFITGGNVVFTVAPVNLAIIAIVRDPVLLQPLMLTETGALPATEFEKALDRAVMMVQRISDRILHSIRLPDSYSGVFNPVIPVTALAPSSVIQVSTDGTTFVPGPTADQITNAQSSATAAAASATTAAGSATTAAGSATAAAGSATSASTSAATATTQATNASTSATNAATSASNASISATSAASSANVVQNYFNRLYNSNFPFWQRGTSIAVAQGATLYGPDRWYGVNNIGTGGVVTMAQVAGVSTGAQYGCSFKVTTAPTTSQTVNYSLRYTIEAQDTLALIGQALSLWLKIKALGNVNQVEIDILYLTSEGRVALTLGSYVYQFTVNPVGFVDCKMQNFNSGATIPAGGVLGFMIRASQVSTGNIWDLNNGFVVEQAMLSIGTSCPPAYSQAFARVQGEFAACQRYYEKSYNLATTPGTVTGVGQNTFYAGGTNAGFTIQHKVSKRPNASMFTAIYNPSTGATGSAHDTTGSVELTISSSPTEQSHSPGGVWVAGHTYIFHWATDSEI